MKSFHHYILEKIFQVKNEFKLLYKHEFLGGTNFHINVFPRGKSRLRNDLLHCRKYICFFFDLFLLLFFMLRVNNITLITNKYTSNKNARVTGR